MKKLLLVSIFWMVALQADQAKPKRVTIINETGEDVHVALYYFSSLPKSEIKKSGVSYRLPKNEKKNISRPNFKAGYLLKLAVSFNGLDLKNKFNNKKDFERVFPPTQITGLDDGELHIKLVGGELRTYTEKENAKIEKKIEPGVHSQRQAVVRVGNGVSPEEKNALNKRLALSESNLRNKIGQVKKVPKVAVVCSGGGFRAMILTLGWLAGAEKIGLLDSVTWLCGLSGSTWAIGSWIQEQRLGNSSVDKFRNQLFRRIDGKTIHYRAPKNEKGLIDEYMKTVPLLQTTLVNYYGASLANLLLGSFGSERQKQKLSQQVSVVENGKYPLPIYTAISGEPATNLWYSFSPWEVSLNPIKAGGNAFSVPTWGFGRLYQDGKSIVSDSFHYVEPSLGWDMGTFGMAFAASYRQTAGEALDFDSRDYKDAQKAKIKDDARSIEGFSDVEISKHIENTRVPFSWAWINNYTKGMKTAPFHQKKLLKLIDAGLDFNLPYPVISGLNNDRSPDIIIFMDGSGNIPKSDREFREVERYARAKNLKYPKIDYNTIMKRSISVFKDEDPTTPIVIYMPWVKDESIMHRTREQDLNGFDSLKQYSLETCCSTVKGVVSGSYTYQEAMELSKLMEFNVRANKDIFWNAIAERAGVAAQ